MRFPYFYIYGLVLRYCLEWPWKAGNYMGAGIGVVFVLVYLRGASRTGNQGFQVEARASVQSSTVPKGIKLLWYLLSLRNWHKWVTMRTCSIDKPGKGYRVHTRVILQYLVPEYVLLRSTPGRALLVASLAPRSLAIKSKMFLGNSAWALITPRAVHTILYCSQNGHSIDRHDAEQVKVLPSSAPTLVCTTLILYAAKKMKKWCCDTSTGITIGISKLQEGTGFVLAKHFLQKETSFCKVDFGEKAAWVGAWRGHGRVWAASW